MTATKENTVGELAKATERVMELEATLRSCVKMCGCGNLAVWAAVYLPQTAHRVFCAPCAQDAKVEKYAKVKGDPELAYGMWVELPYNRSLSDVLRGNAARTSFAVGNRVQVLDDAHKGTIGLVTGVHGSFATRFLYEVHAVDGSGRLGNFVAEDIERDRGDGCETRNDGVRAPIARWETGIRNIHHHLGRAHLEFEVPEVVARVETILNALRWWAETFETADPSKKYLRGRELHLYRFCLGMGLATWQVTALPCTCAAQPEATCDVHTLWPAEFAEAYVQSLRRPLPPPAGPG